MANSMSDKLYTLETGFEEVTDLFECGVAPYSAHQCVFQEPPFEAEESEAAIDEILAAFPDRRPH